MKYRMSGMPDESRSSPCHLHRSIARPVGKAISSNVHFTVAMSVVFQFKMIANLLDLTFPKALSNESGDRCQGSFNR